MAIASCEGCKVKAAEFVMKESLQNTGAVYEKILALSLPEC
jgi:hypothetical protein